MKFTPYTMLWTTGALMFATVAFSQLGSSGALVSAGARSVDRDIASFAARTFGLPNSQLAADTGAVAGELDNTPARIADVERLAAIDGQRVASR